MDWLDYLSLAEDLNKINTQANIRSAMSRSYYSVFNIVREKTDDFSYDNKDGKVHAKLINHLRNSGDSAESAIGTILAGLRDRRNSADYDNENKLTQTSVATDIGSARHILKLLNSKNKKTK